MKKLDWYFDFIGVKSEGWKRLILLLILIWGILIIWLLLDSHYTMSEKVYHFNTYLFTYSTENKFEILPMVYLGSIIGFSFIMSVIRWIKEGFNNE